MHHESNSIIFQQDVTYSAYHTSVGSSTCSRCRHPPPGARTTANTASGTDQPDLLPSALILTVVRAPGDGHQHPKHVELPTEM